MLAGMSHARPGRPPKLSAAAFAPVARALLRPPADAGFALDRWTLAAVAALIARETGVAYNHRHVGRLLRRHGWVVPPFGRDTNGGMRRRVVTDPDGHPIGLFESAR